MQNHKKIFSIIIVLLFSINATYCPPKKESQTTVTGYEDSSADAIAEGSSGSAASGLHSLAKPDADVSHKTFSEWFLVAHALRMTKLYDQESLVETYLQLTSEAVRARSELTKLPTAFVGEIFKLTGMMTFVCLLGRCAETLVFKALSIDQGIIEQSFRNGFSSTHKQFESFVESNFNRSSMPDSLRNVSLIAVLAGGLLKYDILKFLENSDYKEVTSLKKFFTNPTIILNDLRRLLTQPTRSRRSLATPSPSKSSTTPDLSPEELDALARELEETTSPKISKPTPKKKKERSAKPAAPTEAQTAPRTDSKARYSDETLFAQAETERIAREESDATALGISGEWTIVDYARKPSPGADKNKLKKAQRKPRRAPSTLPASAPAPRIKVAVSAPAPAPQVEATSHATAEQTVARTESTEDALAPAREPVHSVPAAEVVGSAPTSTTRADVDARHDFDGDTLPTPATPSSTSGSSRSSTHSTEDSSCPHFASGREEGLIVLGNCSPDQLNYHRYQAMWHIDYFLKWIEIPGCAISLRFWQGRLAGLDPEEKNRKDWSAYKKGLKDGYDAFERDGAEAADNAAQTVRNHEELAHAPGDTEHHRHWLYLKGYHQGILEKQLSSTSASES
jgi:hypothetical protein